MNGRKLYERIEPQANQTQNGRPSVGWLTDGLPWPLPVGSLATHWKKLMMGWCTHFLKVRSSCVCVCHCLDEEDILSPQETKKCSSSLWMTRCWFSYWTLAYLIRRQHHWDWEAVGGLTKGLRTWRKQHYHLARVLYSRALFRYLIVWKYLHTLRVWQPSLRSVGATLWCPKREQQTAVECSANSAGRLVV